MSVGCQGQSCSKKDIPKYGYRILKEEQSSLTNGMACKLLNCMRDIQVSEKGLGVVLTLGNETFKTSLVFSHVTMCSTRWGFFFSLVLLPSSPSLPPPVSKVSISQIHMLTQFPTTCCRCYFSTFPRVVPNIDCYCFFPSLDGEISVLLTQQCYTNDQQLYTCESVPEPKF